MRGNMGLGTLWIRMKTRNKQLCWKTHKLKKGFVIRHWRPQAVPLHPVQKQGTSLLSLFPKFGWGKNIETAQPNLHHIFGHHQAKLCSWDLGVGLSWRHLMYLSCLNPLIHRPVRHISVSEYGQTTNLQYKYLVCFIKPLWSIACAGKHTTAGCFYSRTSSSAGEQPSTGA